MSQFAKGLEGVIANETRLGDVRGQEGQLIYCGYEINELAGKVSFEEWCPGSTQRNRRHEFPPAEL